MEVNLSVPQLLIERNDLFVLGLRTDNPIKELFRVFVLIAIVCQFDNSDITIIIARPKALCQDI